MADRAANTIAVVDTATDTVVHEIALAGAVSPDPAPDLFDVSPDGSRVFLTLRGSSPLTATDPTSHNAAGQTPGVGVVRVERGGARGTLQAIAPLSRVVAGVDVADPHGLRVRRR